MEAASDASFTNIVQTRGSEVYSSSTILTATSCVWSIEGMRQPDRAHPPFAEGFRRARIDDALSAPGHPSVSFAPVTQVAPTAFLHRPTVRYVCQFAELEALVGGLR